MRQSTDPAEADNFRGTLPVAMETATRARRGEPNPALADMTRKITAALDATGVATAAGGPGSLSASPVPAIGPGPAPGPHDPGRLTPRRSLRLPAG